MRHLKHSLRLRGFTLVELLTVVAIVAILAAIAVPMYSKYVKKSRTSEATANLGSIAMYEETYYSENDSYISLASNPSVVPQPSDTGGRRQFSTGRTNWSLLGRVMPDGSYVYFQYEARAGQYNSAASAYTTGTLLVSPSTAWLIGTSGGDVGTVGTTMCAGNTNNSTSANALGIPATASSNWFYVTATGNQDGDSKCAYFIKVIDRPDVVVENDIE